ncbi:MAG TPA: (2Fe-2S)-binding protein [Xanthomonadaceae bacterium]|nr:(2Fe-2S)-binding protein [Xanthomonadaceae bacterium]
MYVCLCNGVTDHQIREVAEAGCRTLAELTMRTGCGATCGSCLPMAQELLDQVHAARDAAHELPLPLPVLHAA